MADDDFPFDDADSDETNEGDTATQAAEDNKSIKQIRDALKREERARKTFEKEVVELREFRDGVLGERKEQAINQVFTEVGLNPKHAELFKRVNPDLAVDAVTADAIKAFASEYELVTSSGEVPEAPVSEPAGFTPVVTGTGSPNATQNADDIEEMLRKGDLDGVRKAFESGRVNKQAPWKQYNQG